MALKYAIVMDRHPEYGVKALPIDLNPATCPPDKLAWSHVFSGPNERGRNYVPEIGQMVLIEDNHFVAGPSGSNFHPVVATLNPAINQQGGLPGNMDLMRAWQEFLTTTKNNLNLPPSVQEKGQPVTRQRVEKGDYTYSTTKGMPAHVSVAQTFGMILPQVKNISTAIDTYSAVLNAGMLAAMPGSMLGNIMSTLSSNPLFQAALGQLPSEVQSAFNSIASFSRSVSGGGTFGFSTGSRINPDSFVQSAINLCSTVKDATELCYALQELQSNTMLHGCETLENQVITVDNALTANANSNVSTSNTGTSNANTQSTVTITSCGSVQHEDGSDVLKALNLIMSLLSTYQSIPSAAAGIGLAGANDVHKKWAEAQKRMPPAIEQARQKLIKDISTSGDKLSNISIVNQIQKLTFKLIS